MPVVKTTIDYSGEDFSRQESSSFQREVDDLDIYDWLWYMVKQSELMGFNVKDVQVFTSDGKAYRTEP